MACGVAVALWYRPVAVCHGAAVLAAALHSPHYTAVQLNALLAQRVSRSAQTDR